MEEIKLEVSLLDQNSKNYISNEIRKWNKLTIKGNIDNIILKDIDFIEDTSYLDDLVKRIAYAVDNDTTYTHNYTKPILPTMSKYPDGREYTPPSDEEFYEMLK